jgi:hypothetical protein
MYPLCRESQTAHDRRPLDEWRRFGIVSRYRTARRWKFDADCGAAYDAGAIIPDIP